MGRPTSVRTRIVLVAGTLIFVAGCVGAGESANVDTSPGPASVTGDSIDAESELMTALTDARARWEADAPVDHSFRSFVAVPSETDRPLQAVDVRDGEVNIAFGPMLALSTVDDWFDFIENEAGPGALLDVSFDPDLGFPTSVLFDDPTAPDDGFEMTGGTVTTLLPDPSDGEPIDPETVPWLAPPDGVEGLDLVESDRYLDADCGAMIECDPYLPSARLRYESTDGMTSIAIAIVQRFPAPRVPDEPVRGDVSGLDVGQRRFVIGVDQAPGRPLSVEVTSNGPDGSVVRIDAVGVEADLVESVIRELVAVEPGAWPQVDRARRTSDEVEAAEGS